MDFSTRFKRPDNPSVDFSGCEKLVAEEFMQEADINFLIARYKNTGSLYTVDTMLKAQRKPQFGDFTGIPDYQQSLDKMNRAMELFSELPLSVRQRFHDNPAELLEFLQHKENLDEAVKLGLVSAPGKPIEADPKLNEADPKLNVADPKLNVASEE